MKTYFPLCFLIIISSFSSCTKEKNRRDQQVLLPLKLGNQWQYETVLYNEDGSVSNSSSTFMIISKDTVVNGNTYFYDGSIYHRNADENTVVSSINGKDFYVSFKRTNVDKTTLETSSGIVNNCMATEILTAYTQITNVNGYESLKNQAELKNCNGVLRKTVIYLAPGMGITKQLLYLKNSTDGSLYLRVKVELKAYKLN